MSKTKQLVQALALGGILSVSATANAALMTSTQSVTFTGSGTASVTDSEGGSASSNDGAPLGGAIISQFSASTGVLMDATVNLNALQKQTTVVNATAGTGTSDNNGNVTSNGTGSSTVQISGSGLSYTFDQVTADALCKAKPSSAACTGTPVSNTQSKSANLSIDANSLNDYVGVISTSASFSASALSANQKDDVFLGTEKTTSTVAWSNNGSSIVYNYLLHALGSFNGTSQQTNLTLDFGTVFQGDTDPALNFSVFNLANANRVGLDLDTVNKSGDFSVLTTNFAPTFNLGQGGSTGFSAFLDTANLGTFNAMYTFNLSDADVGAASTRLNSSLTLNLTGTVAARAAAVPEPFSLALLGIGILGIAANRRRKG